MSENRRTALLVVCSLAMCSFTTRPAGAADWPTFGHDPQRSGWAFDESTLTPKLANDRGTFEGKGIWGGLSAWTDEDGETWIFAPIWGPVSKNAPKFSGDGSPSPNGSVMAFKVALGGSGSPVLEAAWISGNLSVPEPVIIANGVLVALSTGENPHQTKGGADIIYSGQPLLDITERGLNTTHAILYALDARTGKMLYQSGSAMPTWVHFSGLALANSQIFAVDHESRVFCFGLGKK